MAGEGHEVASEAGVVELLQAGGQKHPAGPVQCDSTEAQIVGSAEYVACTYLTFWGTDFTVNASTDCPAEDKATVEITLDASQVAVMDVFGFFNGKTLSAEVSMRKEDDCA